MKKVEEHCYRAHSSSLVTQTLAQNILYVNLTLKLKRYKMKIRYQNCDHRLPWNRLPSTLCKSFRF